MSGRQVSKKWPKCPMCKRRHWPKTTCDRGALLKEQKKQDAAHPGGS